jgi:hypothetical protein
MTVRTRPRFATNPRRDDARDFLTPVPPIVATRLGDTEALAEHERVVARVGELAERFTATQLAERQARVEAEASSRQAIRGGKSVPAKAQARVRELGDKLLAIEGELRVARGLLPETAASVLDASVEHLREAADDCRTREERALDAAERKLAEGLALLDEAGEAAAQGVWVAQVIAEGEAAPWTRGRTVHLRGAAEVRDALARVRAGREQQRERVAELDRERESADLVAVAGSAPRRLPLPPNAETWVMPGEGEPIEAEAEGT